MASRPRRLRDVYASFRSNPKTASVQALLALRLFAGEYTVGSLERPIPVVYLVDRDIPQVNAASSLIVELLWHGTHRKKS